MMTMMLRVILIVVSVITMTFMMRKIRQAKVQIEAAMFWVIMSLILVVFAVVPGAADLCARLLGIYSTPNFLFLFMIFLLIVKAFGMAVWLVWGPVFPEYGGAGWYWYTHIWKKLGIF